VIEGAHTIVFADDAEAARAFRNVLGSPDIDAGCGRLIFALPPGTLAGHPDASAARHQLR